MYQELGGAEPDTVAAMTSINSVREKLKLCMDQSEVALDKIKIERLEFLDCIEKLQQEKKEINEELTALKQDFQGM